MLSFQRYLQEKLLIVGKGANYGQIVFLAGGGGSGKGFARSNFLEGGKFKVRDVDEWKKMFVTLAKLKNKHKEIRGLDLTRPKDVLQLHKFVKERKIKEKTLDLLLANAVRGRLPNIMFDITLKEKGDIMDVLPSLMSVGYDPKSVHIVWVLTNYSIAIKQNRDPERARVVPEDIMLKTHEGAATTMYNFIRKGTPRGVNGGVYIILGGKKNTVFYTDQEGKPIRTGKNKDTFVVKDFKYLVMKEPGKRISKDIGLQKQAHEWIRQNAPRTLSNKELFGTGQKETG